MCGRTLLREDHLGVAVLVQILHQAAGRRQRGNRRPPMGAKAIWGSPVDEGCQTGLVGEDQVRVSVPVQVSRRHVRGPYGGQKRSGIGRVSIGRAPVDGRGHADRVHDVVHAHLPGLEPVGVGQDDLRETVAVQVGDLDRRGSVTGKMDRLAAGVVSVRSAPVEEGAPLRVRIPLVGENQVQVPVPVQVGHLHVPAVHGPEHLPPFGGVTIRRPPIDEGFIVRVHRHVVVQSAVGEDDIRVSVPVQILHRHRPGAAGGEAAAVGGLGPALGAPENE